MSDEVFYQRIPGKRPDPDPTAGERTLDPIRRHVEGQLPAGFPSDEDVEAAAKGVAAGDPADLRCWDEMCEFARNELRLLARAALLAVADAHRTEEKT